jgi:DNA-directed RNA polymerase specialized sigma24 family protein
MSHEDEQISRWISRLQEGDQRAAEVIWGEYFEKIVRLARRRLGSVPRRASDEEDVALSAMNSLFRGAQAGRFPRLEDRDDLWKILVTITARKAVKQQRRHFAEKRGGGQVRGESVLNHRSDESNRVGGIDQVLGREPTPELAEMLAEACQQLVDQLDDDLLKQIATMKLEGFNCAEIATQLRCSKRTIERKLERVREKWSAQ